MTLLAGSWDGQALTFLSSSEERGQAWVLHHYPGRDGADAEPMGKRAAILHLTVRFFGAGWYDAAFAFISGAEAATEPKALAHPYWGYLTGVITDIRVELVDVDRESVRVSFTFSEAQAAPFAFAAGATLSTAASAVSTSTAGLRSASAAL